MPVTHAVRSQAEDASPKGALRTAMEEQVIIDHLPLADSIARKFGRYGHDLEDMIQVARLALVKAARRFEPQRNPNFVAFARPTIAGEIKRYLRDHAWMVQPPRGVQELQVELMREYPVMCQRLGREPTVDELAAHLGQEPGAVAEAVVSYHGRQPESLDKAEDGRSLEEQIPDGEADAFAAVDDSIALAAALRELTPEQKQLLRMRFFEDQSQQRIGEQTGMSQVQVSRALSRILVKLQRHMLNLPPCESRHQQAPSNRVARVA